jgi:hypothetical protein
VTTAENLLARMAEQLVSESELPHLSAADVERMSTTAMIRDSGAAVLPESPTLAVRLHGAGIQGSEVGLEEAFDILNPLQHAFSAMGQSVAQIATAAGKIPGVIKKATKLRFSPAIGVGSVVFNLLGPAEPTTGDEIPALVGTETLADVTMGHLMQVIKLADETDNTSQVADRLRRFGPRSAKHLNDLAGAVISHDIDVSLNWRTDHSSRAALLNRRGALGLQGAISHNRTQTNTITLPGILVTASMVEPVTIKLDDQRLIHLTVDSELAQTLDQFCFKRVVAHAEETIEWRLSKGTEVRKYALLTIHLAE